MAQDVFPLHPSHPYRPQKADLVDLLRFEKSQGIDHVCLIAFSVYGDDNSSLLDALRRLKGRARGVVCVDPTTKTRAELESMHRLGVRGVRLNLHTTLKRPEVAALSAQLRQYADLIRPLNWALQIFCAMDQIEGLAPIIPTLGVPVIFDHMGQPAASLPPQQQRGYREFLDLLRSGQVWTKMSGVYRYPAMPELDEYVATLLNLAPDRIVWASDWPHSGGVSHNPGGDRDKMQPYRKIDDKEWIRRCKRWCRNDDELIHKIWVENPRKLWQYSESN